MVMASLENSTIGFKRNVVKGKLDHIEVQRYVYNEAFESYIESNTKDIED